MKRTKFLLATATAFALAATPALAAAKTRYVSVRGHDRGACTQAKPCASIAFAVARTPAHGVVIVRRGSYAGNVKITKDITLTGVGMPVINARGLANGILIAGSKSVGATVQGFVVQNATDEGILAMQTSHVSIIGNTVRGNDRGVSAAHPTGECAAQGQVPGDCGEGLHLMTVSHAKVSGNTVKDNLGGILLTDELGPTAHNLVKANTVLDNVGDCGITLAGHSTAAFVAGRLAPSKAGVFDNHIMGNTVNGNGTKGLGGGILTAAGAPGSAVYGNLIEGNTADGNGLGGFTLHSHAPGQYLNGNRVIDNTFMDDGVAGNPGGKPGDVDAGITHSVGIIVFSAVTPLKGTVVRGNHLGREYYGIWTKNVPAITKHANKFAHSVTVDLSQN
ncbi:MAG: right-handed parallel beta-helix repeat-containing protein [Solirubrobacteraceae bacterium]